MKALVKRLIPRGLMGRALLIVVTPLILMQVLSSWFFLESHWDKISKRLSLGVAGDVMIIADGLHDLPDASSRDWLLEQAGRVLDIDVTMKPGAILPRVPGGENQIEGELRRALLAKGLTKPVRVVESGSTDSIMVYVQLPEGVLELVTPRARLFSWTTYLFVLWTVGMSLILLGLATMFMRSQVRPVRRLARAADAFGKGRDVPDFRPEGAREVRLAALAFLAMRNRIQRQIAQRTAMLAGVSHDLRTPLTRMKLELEMMPKDAGIEDLKSDVADMERMLEGYLAFARGEGGEKSEASDLGELLEEAVRRARRKGGTIDLTTEGELTLPLKPDAVLRCLVNLLDNAQRYARRIAVRGKRRTAAVEVTIDDDGPGIPPDKREDVFRPFFRLEGSRNPVTGGVGLGLTIARDVARSHGGDILLEDAPSGGLRVRLWFPI